MRVRLRPAWSEAELREFCPVPHDHTHWADHIVRVQDTIALAHELAPHPQVIADLSCGDAAIPRALAGMTGDNPSLGPSLILGDFAPGYEITGMIEQTVTQVTDADLWIFSETAEHLDDPDAMLKQIRKRAWNLVLSTPLSEFTPINPQHYWGWDHDGVREMLEGAGWKPVIQRDVLHPLAQFQIWGCQ